MTETPYPKIGRPKVTMVPVDRDEPGQTVGRVVRPLRVDSPIREVVPREHRDAVPPQDAPRGRDGGDPMSALTQRLHRLRRSTERRLTDAAAAIEAAQEDFDRVTAELAEVNVALVALGEPTSDAELEEREA